MQLSYARTTTVHIAEFAGLTRGALKHHYESREDWILATWREVHARFLARFDSTSMASHTLDGRVDRMVEIAWQLYTSPEYLAATEIRLETRSEVGFAKRFNDPLASFNSAYEEKWQSLFKGFASADRIEQGKRVIGGSPRGLALQRVTERDEAYFESSLATCKLMLKPYLSE